VLGGGGESNILTQELELPSNCNHTLTFSVVQLGAHAFEMDLYINGVVVETYTTTDIKSYTINSYEVVQSM